MLIEFAITFIKTFFFNISTSFAFLKIEKYEKLNNTKLSNIIILNILVSCIYGFLYKFFQDKNINAAITNIICYCVYMIIFCSLVEIKIKRGVYLGVLSISIAFSSIITATAISFTILKIFSMDMNNENIIEYTFISILQIILIYLFFKLKRFKDGFSFLKKENVKLKYLKILGIIISATIIFIVTMFCINKGIVAGRIFTTAVIIIILIMLYWIRKSITKYYKEKMKDRTIEIKNKEIQEKEEIINNLKLELSNVLEINHKYNHRISAMEKAIGKFGDKLSFNEEFANEYSDILDTLKEFSTEYKKEFEEFNTLPKTNIFSIDNLLEYMKAETLRNNIEFELCLNTNIEEIIKRHISKNKLETLLTDHITDAIIAINSSDNSNRKIKVVINKDKELYKISILDTGIEFEIETLLKLGLERITTHKDTGGTGIGFMTTFKTLDESRASLIIEEYNKEKEIYTKSINILFDGKKRYSINSHRIDKIRMQNKENRNINLDNK